MVIQLPEWLKGKPFPGEPLGCAMNVFDRSDIHSGQTVAIIGMDVSVGCSWNLSAGRDAVIELLLYGTQGGLSIRNVNGSFYDFIAERFSGTSCEKLHGPPDDWGGRAAVGWARNLGHSPGYDAAIEQAVTVATIIDRIYES
ncbi:MAG: hypothetical protein GF401_08970 [Chitinivibrionales bacterium]|nr:hypothetical protein [Chitinivibrionales bacterium]